MKLLSIIVPAYNSEGFLDKGIPTMLVPEVLDQLEIIIVNDGSTDATAAVAQTYCTRYPDTVRLICQENKGHGGALNTGCAAARGKYLKVIDSDDWVESRNLPAFLQFLEETDSDVILTPFHTVDIGSGEILKWRTYPQRFGEALSLEQIMGHWRSFYRCLTFHGITYHTAFYQAHSTGLTEHVFYEDYEFATFPCCYAKTVTPLDLFIYNYRIGDVNQSVSDASKRKRIGHLETVLRRMIEKSNAGLSASGLEYAAMKTQELFLSYLTVALLIEPDRKKGRQMAKAMAQEIRSGFPMAAALAEKKYRVFCLMNRLHISKQTWEAFLSSKFYRLLRRNRDFS